MKEHYYEKLLNINTMGSKDEVNNSIYYHPYEPTPYRALEVLSTNYQIQKSDHIVDFGCGKGRLLFYLNYTYHVSVVGIEMNNSFFKEALKNKENYLQKVKCSEEDIQFYCCKAEQYEVKNQDNRFYFFNPFSIQIFMKVINNILRSVEQFPRMIDIILYYASDDYRFYLETQTSFELLQEIPLPGLYEKNVNERFLIYRWKQY